MFRHRHILILGGVLAAAALAPAAQASSLSLEGDVLVLRAASGEKNWLTVGPGDVPGQVKVSDTTTPSSSDASACTPDPYSSFVTCAVPAGGVRLEAGDRDDILDVHDDLPAGVPITLDGGAGADVLRGAAFTATADRLLGGEGDDKITGGQGPDVVEGGAGDDELDARQGPDVIHGGEGNDRLGADYFGEQSADIVDGGPGYDQIEGNWTSASGTFQPPIVVSIDGTADDGRPGEGDNVTAVERIYLNAPATLTGSDGPDELTIFNVDAGSVLNGRGGDDRLSGFDLADTIDGGAGNDTIEGGYGDDAITGGPGRDAINADVSGTTCHVIQCRMPYGNDHVDARDGEADAISCGIGTDVVEADPEDTVGPDCETVHRTAAAATAGPGRGTGSATLLRLRAHRQGAFLIVRGEATGTPRVTVAVLRGRRTLARVQARVRAGRFRARVRASGRVRVIVTTGGLRRRVTIS